MRPSSLVSLILGPVLGIVLGIAVALDGLTVKGFKVALSVTDGSGWTISGNDFSDNYDDPAVSWTDGPLAGAILLEGVAESHIEHNTAQRNWNGLTLRGSDGNTITG